MASKYIIIPEDTLEKLVCSKCYNYLSFRESKIGNGEIICGRCDQEDTILPFFTRNIRQSLFPCINRFDNCKELLLFGKVEEHEKKCTKSTNHSCTECGFSGNGCQLYHHYLKKHDSNILKYPIFRIDLMKIKKWNFLYRKNNNLFLITYEIIRENLVLKLTIRAIGSTDQNPQYEFILKTVTKEKQIMQTQCKTVTTEDDSYELDFVSIIREHEEYSVMCHLNVHIKPDLFFLNQLKPTRETETEKLIEKENQLKHIMDALYENLFPKLSCCNCGCFVVPPIYRCPSNHVRCEVCLSSFCSRCDDVTNWSRAFDLEVFHDIIPLPCRWNCTNALMSDTLRNHEKECRKRLYKCVEKWCPWSGTLNNLIEHWHHDSAPVYTREHQIYGFNKGLVEFYLIFDDEIFYWRIDPLRKEGRNVHVRSVSDVTSASGRYVATVFLEHRCDNRTRKEQIDVNLGGITLIERYHFATFEPCNNYKIIFLIE